VGYLHFCNLLFIQMQGGLSSFLQSFVHSNKEWYFVNLALISSWFTQDQMLCFLYHHTNHNFSLGIIKTISFLTFLERFFIHWFFIQVFFIPVLETISITTPNWTYYRFFRSQTIQRSSIFKLNSILGIIQTIIQICKERGSVAQ